MRFGCRAMQGVGVGWGGALPCDPESLRVEIDGDDALAREGELDRVA